MDSFKLEILVPSGKVLSADVETVSLPTENGEVGILPDHASYTATLGTGILEYVQAGSHGGKSLVISGGIVQFSNGTLKVLADTVDEREKIKKGEYDTDRATLEQSISNVDITTPSYLASKMKLDRINAIDMLISRIDRSSMN